VPIRKSTRATTPVKVGVIMEEEKEKNYGKQYSYCHKVNDTTDECYSKHGFPPWMKQKMNYTANALEKEGDLVSETEKQAHNETLNEQIFKAFGPEQLQKLINMIQDSKNKDKVINNTIRDLFAIKSNIGKRGMHSWIIDIGATDHVACSLSSFTSYYKIKPVKVKLQNNQSVTAACAGTVILAKNIILYNVLYIPNFMLNIISIQRLTNSLGCQLLFSQNACQIQEKTTLKMIGRAEIKNGLYQLCADKEDSLVFFLSE